MNGSYVLQEPSCEKICMTLVALAPGRFHRLATGRLAMDFTPGIVDVTNADRRVWLVKVKDHRETLHNVWVGARLSR